MDRQDVYKAIDSERVYQDNRWGTIGENPHTIVEWWDLIAEELKEVDDALTLRDAVAELRQVAALCVAALEQYGCPLRGWGGAEDDEAWKHLGDDNAATQP